MVICTRKVIWSVLQAVLGELFGALLFEDHIIGGGGSGVCTELLPTATAPFDQTLPINVMVNGCLSWKDNCRAVRGGRAILFEAHGRPGSPWGTQQHWTVEGLQISQPQMLTNAGEHQPYKAGDCLLPSFLTFFTCPWWEELLFSWFC